MNAALLLLLAQAPASEPAPLPAAPVGDPVLASQRGGFQLPNGIDVALTVQTQTALNGAILLRTVFQVDQGAPSLTIYAPKPGETVSAGSSAVKASTNAAAPPTITYDRDAGLQVVQGIPRSSVSVGVAGGTAEAVPGGLVQVAPGAVTDAGTVSEASHNGVRAVSLAGTDLTITHLAGDAFGSAIANSGSDRAIDTTTSVSIALGGTADTMGPAMFRLQDVALGSVAIRGN